jgi:hypothetical protein
MKKINSLVVILGFMLGGCYTLNLNSSASTHPISLSNMPKGSIIKHFTIEKSVGHLIYGLVTLNDIDVQNAISNEIESAGGTEAVNVKIKYQATFVDGLLNGITLGIYNPYSLVIEGDIAN